MPAEEKYRQLLGACEYVPQQYRSTDEWVAALWNLREYLYYAGKENGRPDGNPDGQCAKRETSSAR